MLYKRRELTETERRSSLRVSSEDLLSAIIDNKYLETSF